MKKSNDLLILGGLVAGVILLKKVIGVNGVEFRFPIPQKPVQPKPWETGDYPHPTPSVMLPSKNGSSGGGRTNLLYSK